MAENYANKVLLGFEDELISDKYKNQVNFTTNKIGGKPDLPTNIKLESPTCPLCQLPRPLIVQIYAPLDNLYHRTLYLFACINPNCFTHNESWYCIRIQSQEQIIESTISESPDTPKIDWCAKADDWDDNNANITEENGNLINNIERVSDEDDESCSLEDSLRAGLVNLMVDDKNANTGGAVGRLLSPSATAEIEGDEGEIITIDTPTFPQRDIAALLTEATPLPQEIDQSSKILQFVPFFMSVWEETATSSISDKHVKELLQEYQQRNDDLNVSPDNAAGAEASFENFEKYEKSDPTHGDKMFHHFLSKIQANPSQILRYSRDGNSPLFLYPIVQDFPRKCVYCDGDLIFEFQILPTLISKLKLISDANNCSRLEFGTVLIFTCRKSCWATDANFRQEVVVLQREMY